MNADRTVLTDAMWARIEHMLPGKATDPGATAADNRRFLEAVLWRSRTGSPWRDLPERFGNWNSVFYGTLTIANWLLWVVRSTAYKSYELSRARPRLMLYGISISPGASCRARELRIALRSGDAAMLPAGSGQ